MADFQQTTAVLDRNVFDFGFHIADTLPTVWKISVAREFQQIQAGQTIGITVHIMDTTTTYGHSFPFNPGVPPTMTLYDPEGVVILGSPFSMSQIGIGVYTYIYASQVTDPLGIYTAQFHASNGSVQMITRKSGVFTILEPHGV
jgi:hypothetical protein